MPNFLLSNEETFMSTDPRHLKLDYVELRTSNGELHAQTKKFYATVFGWQYKDWGPDYADTRSSGVSSGIAVDTDNAGKPLPVVFASDLDASRTSAIAAGARITKDIFTFPGGRRFQFLDPAGNEFAVWSDR
jgi:predicted enzyme related to lactoylglutathione lyase